MSLPTETANVLLSLGYGLDVDFEAGKDKATGEIVLTWLSQTPQPTDQEIIDAANSQAFIAWQEEHGGDPVKTARRITKEATSTPAGKLLVALVSAMAKNGIFGAATKQQIINAILAEVDLGEAD